MKAKRVRDSRKPVAAPASNAWWLCAAAALAGAILTFWA
jgi:hypothetical protein